MDLNDLPSVYELIKAQGAALAAGVMIDPYAYRTRVKALERRGLAHSVCLDLDDAGDLSLLRRAEALTDAQIHQVNAVELAAPR